MRDTLQNLNSKRLCCIKSKIFGASFLFTFPRYMDSFLNLTLKIG